MLPTLVELVYMFLEDKKRLGNQKLYAAEGEICFFIDDALQNASLSIYSISIPCEMEKTFTLFMNQLMQIDQITEIKILNVNCDYMFHIMKQNFPQFKHVSPHFVWRKNVIIVQRKRKAEHLFELVREPRPFKKYHHPRRTILFNLLLKFAKRCQFSTQNVLTCFDIVDLAMKNDEGMYYQNQFVLLFVSTLQISTQLHESNDYSIQDITDESKKQNNPKNFQKMQKKILFEFFNYDLNTSMLLFKLNKKFPDFLYWYIKFNMNSPKFFRVESVIASLLMIKNKKVAPNKHDDIFAFLL